MGITGEGKAVLENERGVDAIGVREISGGGKVMT